MATEREIPSPRPSYNFGRDILFNTAMGNGKFIESDEYNTSVPITCKESTTYEVGWASQIYFGNYDGQYNGIMQQLLVGTPPFKIKTPLGCNCMIPTFKIGDDPTVSDAIGNAGMNFYIKDLSAIQDDDNLFDCNSQVIDDYVFSIYGEPTWHPGGGSTDYLPVDPGTKYLVPGYYSYGWFDENKKIIFFDGVQRSTEVTLSSPPEARFFRASWNQDSKPYAGCNFYLKKASTIPVVPPDTPDDPVPTTKQFFNPLYQFWLGVNNLFDWSTQTTYGFRLADTDFDAMAQDAEYNTTDAINVKTGIGYEVSPFAVGYGYSANRTRVYTIPHSGVVTFPENVAYVKFSLLKSNSEQDVKLFTISGGYDHEAHPIYKSDLAIDYEKETNQEFFRRKLSGKLDFIDRDFDYIMSVGFDEQVNVKILHSDDLGKTWKQLWLGKFFRTDCTVDIDDKLISVTPDVNDEYTAILAGMEKEFNLVELGLPTIPVNYWRRPLLQIYIPGEDVVTNYVGNIYFEQDSENITNYSDLISKYKFALASIDMQIEVLSTGGIPSSYAGVYRGRGTYLANTNSWQASLYKEGSTATRLVYKSAGVTKNNEDFEFYLGASTTPIYKKNQSGQFGNNRSVQLDTQSGGTGTMVIEVVYGLMFMRYLLDVDSFQGQEIFPIPTEDIVTNERGYKNVTRFTINVGVISGREQSEPTKWGRSDRNTYYLPPNDTAYFVPISQNKWGKSSYWLQTALIDNTYEAPGRRQITLNDAYPISSVIQKLLNQIAPGITHGNAPVFSQILYGTPNPLEAQKITLCVTPKTNMTKGEYQTPAQKGNITFKQVMNMLCDAFRCYWYVENNLLKIEHLSFFDNGGTYTGNRKVGMYLKNLLSFPTRKPWAFKTSNYTFDKINMPEQYTFEWMDETTEVFNGLPIDVLSNYVEAGKIEEKNISQFTTDVDYMTLNPGEISKDGFALLGAIQTGSNIFNIDVVPLVVDGFTYYVQNAYLSMAYLQPHYLIYGMPAKYLNVNNKVTNAKSIARNRKQTINIPVTWDINPIELINTSLGDGEIEKLSINLCSLISKTTLKYDTQQ